MSDERIVAGARCTWWDSIDKVATRNSLPVCPHCGNVLYEFESQEIWDGMVAEHDSVEPGYEALVAWGRGKCFPNYEAVKAAYAKRSLH